MKVQKYNSWPDSMEVNLDLPASVADALPNACIGGATSNHKVSIIRAVAGDNVT
jgi:hypothetical protein